MLCSNPVAEKKKKKLFFTYIKLSYWYIWRKCESFQISNLDFYSNIVYNLFGFAKMKNLFVPIFVTQHGDTLKLV